jgi:hypothetical protein
MAGDASDDPLIPLPVLLVVWIGLWLAMAPVLWVSFRWPRTAAALCAPGFLAAAFLVAAAIADDSAVGIIMAYVFIFAYGILAIVCLDDASKQKTGPP